MEYKNHTLTGDGKADLEVVPSDNGVFHAGEGYHQNNGVEAVIGGISETAAIAFSQGDPSALNDHIESTSQPGDIAFKEDISVVVKGPKESPWVHGTYGHLREFTPRPLPEGILPSIELVKA